MQLETVTDTRSLRKLQWLRSFSAVGKRKEKRLLGLFGRASDQWIRYKQGEVILVEVLGERDFHDPKKGVSFHVGDPSQMRLF